MGQPAPSRPRVTREAYAEPSRTTGGRCFPWRVRLLAGVPDLEHLVVATIAPDDQQPRKTVQREARGDRQRKMPGASAHGGPGRAAVRSATRAALSASSITTARVSASETMWAVPASRWAVFAGTATSPRRTAPMHASTSAAEVPALTRTARLGAVAVSDDAR